MKDKLKKLNELTNEILEYFGPDIYHSGTIGDNTDSYWWLNGEEGLYWGAYPPVLEDDCLDANYAAEVRGIYYGKDYTMVLAYHGCGGDAEMMILDNSKKKFLNTDLEW